MDSYLALFTTARSLRSSSTASPTSPPDVCEYKLSARRHHHRKRPTAITRSTASSSSSKASPLRCQTRQQRPNVNDVFRSVAVLGEVMRLETDASRAKLQLEDAFALLSQILSPQDLIDWSAGGEEDDGKELSLTEMLDGIDAACWQTLAPTDEDSVSPSDFAPRSPRHDNHHHCEADARSKPVKVRFSQLYSGVQAAILEKQRVLKSLQAKLQQAVERNDELPGVIREREVSIRRLKETFMAGAAKTLDCDDELSSPQRMCGNGKARLVTARAVEEKVQTLRRRRDLRVWACNELRSTINDHMTRASELKKEIATLVADVKREEMAHKLKAKRVETIMATATSKSSGGVTMSVGGSVQRVSPEDVVTQAHEKKQQLLEEIEQRKTHLRARTEEVFNARNEVSVLELKRAKVAASVAVLEQEIAHIQRSCTPRPEWTQLLNAALVTTAIDRAGKNAKLRMESSRKKLMGGNLDADTDEQEESGDKRLKQILTSNWSTIDKVYTMSEELTRIRTKYHAGDTIIVEQVKLDHLQKEIAKALQQLEVIKAKAADE